MNAIAAVSLNWGIGRAGELLFHIPEDLRRFRALTAGGTVVMGRKTLESLPGGRPLPNRRNIVLTRNAAFTRPGVETAGSAEALFTLLGDQDPDRVWVCGGGEIYRLLLPWCRTCHITRVYDAPESDAFFPDLDRLPRWRLARSEAALAYGDTAYQFVVYEATEGEEPPCRS